MKDKEIAKMALTFFKKDKTRAVLTVIGVIIGIFMILLVTGIGEGIVQNTKKEFESFGNDKLFVVPVSEKDFSFAGAGRRVTNKLYKEDVDAIKNIKGIKRISYMVWNRARVEFKGEGLDISVYGVNGRAMFDQWKDYFKIKEGRILRDNDGYSAVIGYDVAYELFDKDIKVGDKININGKEFRVVGILEKVGNSFSQTDDQSIMINIDKAREIFGDLLLKNEVSYISIQVEDENKVEEIKKAVEAKIARKHKVSLDDKDFTVLTSKYIKEQTNSILSLVSLSSIIIAGISSIIGALGISNTMFTSVAEKRRIIGIMRAIGMKRRDVVKLFIAESAIIGGIGGLIGIGLSLTIGYLLTMFNVPFVVNPIVLFLTFLYGIAVGIIAGLIPSLESTKITPIEAISYG